MGFKVIESYDEAAALGQCGLLWFRCDDADDWMPSRRTPDRWSGPGDFTGRVAVAEREYAILLED